MISRSKLTSVQDRNRLIEAADRVRTLWLSFMPHVERFHLDLRRSRAVSPAEVPEDVVTMNSRFALHHPRTDESITYSLVYPEKAASAQGKVSVLSPMGLAPFAARIGDEVRWLSEAGPKAATVRQILYQPEAAGHLHL